MVSKVAVIALVVIVACPILLGYALNLDEVSHTEYKAKGDYVDVTQLLWNNTAYAYTYVDAYQLNKNTAWSGNVPMMPIYNSLTTNKSSLPLEVSSFPNWSGTGTQNMDYPYIYEQFDYDPDNNSHTATLYGMVNGVEQSIETINNIHAIYYENTSNEYWGMRFTGNGDAIISFHGTADLTKMIVQTISGTANIYLAYYSTNSYVDISAGFYFILGHTHYGYYPLESNTALYTINLDSITAANCTYRIVGTGLDYNNLEKTTVNGNVSWKLINPSDSTYFDLYYDPSRNDNSYQIYQELNKVGTHTVTVGGYTTVFNDYELKTTFRYVGSWPTIIGEANHYRDYEFTKELSYSTGVQQPRLYFGFLRDLTGNVDRSLTMRIDGGTYGSMKYAVIADKIYNPVDFKTNPSTTITDVTKYGSSLTFAGNTYDVSNGNITLGTHQVSVESLVFDSVPIYNGYENRINGNVISVTADPSTITFNGSWVANVKTDSMEATTVYDTEWIAGEFAWDGIDDNFLMAGLLTSLGVFIALGIYSRRSKSSVWPLMLVTGCAAFVFLLMM